MTRLSIFAAAREAPQRIALIIENAALTYAEIAALARGRAAALAKWRRPLLLQPELDLDGLLWLYAAAATGTPFVALHPGATAQERAAAQALTGARGPPQPDPTVTRGIDFLIDPAIDRAIEPEIDSEASFALVLTSGSTGTPKGIVLSRRAVLASAAASAGNMGLAEEERWLLCLPLSHVGGLSVVVRMLCTRRTVLLFGPGSTGLMSRMGDLGRRIHEQRVTLVSLVPSLLERLLQQGFRPPSTLRAVLLGGAGCSSDLAARARDAGVPLLTSYGLTESGSQIAARRYAERHGPLPELSGRVSSGHPLAGVELKILGGRIAVKTAALFSGYVGAAESPLDADGWFLTSDRGTIGPAGELYVLGRTDLVIITGGENVDPEEVESALRALPQVRDACVFGVPSAEFGQRVVAVVTAASGAAPFTLEQLAPQLHLRLNRFKLPRSLVVADELPFTPAGKLDRAACAGRFAQLC